MGASEWGKPPNALRAKGVEKEEEEEEDMGLAGRTDIRSLYAPWNKHPRQVPVTFDMQPGLETDHSPPSMAEVKNAWSYTCTSPVRLHGVMLS
jgi:hypothetical protein